jgi:NADH-quinone oxidoreductase subunit N
MNRFNYIELFIRFLPEAILVVGALIALFLDQARAAAWSERSRSVTAVFIGLLSVILAILVISRQDDLGDFYNGMLQISAFTKVVKVGLLVLTAATLLIAAPAKFTTHIGEYVALLLIASVGLLLLTSTGELLTAFISLELTSLSLYLLTAFHKGSVNSAEAALKYFLFGSVAAAFTLFGISLVFGLAGSTNFDQIAQALPGQKLSPLLIAGLVLTAMGFAFKMAAAPLHLWAPDAYQGAPIPSAALIASGSKLASFVLFMKFFLLAVPGQIGAAGWGKAAPGWAVAIAAISATSVIVGNLLAIAQSNVRRLIAYSAVAHAGYVLIALLANSANGAASAVYYLFTYGLAVIGIFGVIGAVEARHGELTLTDLAGLSRRAPLLALCLFVFVLSLAGIPPLAGFFGKFYVFIAALESSSAAGGTPLLLWIVVLAIAGSAVSLFYYLQILKQAFVIDGAGGPAIFATKTQKLTLSVLAAAVVLFGCFPNTLLQRLQVPGSTPQQEGPAHDHDHPHQETSRNSAHLLANLK